jgi:16S rRNA (uracil1498-N3)-methyltransferase
VSGQYLAREPAEHLAQRRSAAAQVVVENLQVPRLDPADRHHLERVLRLRRGESVVACDGRGGWRMTRFVGGDLLDLDGEVVEVPPPQPLLSVAFAPVKGDRPEWVVQKLTELGIDRIVPVQTARSVVRWDGDRAILQHDRLVRVAREAAAQSRRVHLPEVAMPATLASLLASGAPLRLAEPGGQQPMADGVMVVVGPEGGFTDEERAAVPERVGLPGGVLRAETAAVALGVLLSAARDILAES